jgi:DNA-directed RNA polymerase subunit RPC12/RpoP
MGMLYKVDAYILEQEQVVNFYVLCHNFDCAIGQANAYLENEFDDRYEILKIEAKPKFNIVNVMNEDDEGTYRGECSDPFEVGEHCVPEMLMKFKCLECGYEICVADNGWIEVRCPECGKPRSRNTLKLVDGVWVDIPEEIENK